MNGLLYNGSLFEGIAAGMGLLSIPKTNYVQTDIEGALKILDEHGGPVPFICWDENPGFYPRGIRRLTNSCVSHAGIFTGAKQAQQVRKNHPDLMKTRKLPGSIPRPDGYDWSLPPVPERIEPLEIIESQPTIALNSMSNIVSEGKSAIAFLRDWTPEQADAILYAAYYLFGAPYDVTEIAKYIWSWMPNPNSLKVCSTFQVAGLRGKTPGQENSPEKGDIEIANWLIAHGANPEQSAPGHNGKYFFSSSKYKPVVFHCDLDEAKNKV